MSAFWLIPLLASAANPAAPMRLDCQLALALPQGQLTAPTPVTISFLETGRVVSDVRVTDAGGILFPGGNMRMVTKADAIALEAVAIPPERPGEWRGVVEKKMYRLTLKSGNLAKAVEIGLGKAPDKQTGRIGLVWNATNQPEGMPQPISGSGVGSCAILSANSK